MPHSASTTIMVEECPWNDMETPVYLSSTMVAIKPLYFNLPEKLNTDSEEPLLIPVSVNPSITITFPENPVQPDGTLVTQVSFPAPSNIESVKIYNKSPADQDWVEMTQSDNNLLFDATEPIVFDEPIRVSLLKFVPLTPTDNDIDFRMKLQVHACLQATPSITGAPTTIRGISTPCAILYCDKI